MADTGKMKRSAAGGPAKKYEKKNSQAAGSRKSLFGGIEKNRSLRKIRRIFQCKKGESRLRMRLQRSF